MLKSVALLILAMISIQSGATLAKNIFQTLGAAGTSAMRLFFATIILWSIFRPWRIRFTPSQWKKLAVYGSALGLMNLTFYFALARIPLGVTVALEFTGPLAVAIFSSKKKTDYVWAVLAAIGIYLLLPLSEASHLDLVGVIFALTAVFSGVSILSSAKKQAPIYQGVSPPAWECFLRR